MPGREVAGGVAEERVILDLLIAAAVILATSAVIFVYAYCRSRPPPPQPLSDSAGSAQFAQQQEEARGGR